MYYYYAPLLTKSGDVLSGYFVRLFAQNGDAVDLFADDNGTPIDSASGVVNAAKSDDLGMVRFWVPNGTYDISQYDTTDTFKGKEQGVPLFDAGAISTDLGSTDADKGASLVATEGGGNVQEAIVARPTAATLASSSGAGMLGSISPFSGATERTQESRIADSRSVLDWFTDAERAAAIAGDLSLDMTAAIQLAMDSAAPVIDMHDYAYRIDSVVNLPVAGKKITGKGWSAERGAGVVNNGGKMFFSDGATGLIEFENGTVTGNVVRGGPGYDPFAVGIYVEDSTGGLALRNMRATGFTGGCYVKYVDGLRVSDGCVMTGNIQTGLSGFAKNVMIEDSRFFANGYVGSSGQTHDLYLINSAHGVVRNCYIGDPVDVLSDSFSFRYDLSSAVAGYDDYTDWEIYGNKIAGGSGMRHTSDPGSGGGVARKPPSNIRVYSNVFAGGAGLRFDDPQDCRSWSNKGINSLQVAVISLYPSYVVGFISENDECVRVFHNALTAKRLESMAAVIFKGTTINNGAATAFNEIVGVGGLVACTIIEPRVLGTGLPFDTAALARYTTNLEIPVRASKSMRHMERSALAETAIANAATWNPANHTATDQTVLIGRLNGATATLGAPTVSATGMRLRLLLRVVSASGTVVTPDAGYKLTTATASALSTGGALNQRMALEFVYETAAWRQVGESAWAAA